MPNKLACRGCAGLVCWQQRPDYQWKPIIMKTKIVASFLALALLAYAPALRAQTAETTTNGLTLLITQVRADLKAGKHTEADLADDLKQFDVLLAAENGKPTEQAARILFMKAMLYAQVLENPDQAKAILTQVKTQYPGTKAATQSDQALKMIDHQAELEKQFAAGKPFPDFSVTDLAGKPLSVANYKGKVVLVDFWATWCGPCRAELPNVVATYAKYHDQGFEIIGVSLDQDKDKLVAFTKENNMTWPQYFDGQGWQNKVAVQYSIESIPATVLIDAQGNIINHDLRGEALTEAVAKALAK
jgi:thiol-disulfide isomerase/thioredoxin